MTGPVPVVVAPLAEEIESLVARMRRVKRRRSADRITFSGEIAGRRLVASVIGDGAGSAERGLATLLAEFQPERLLLLGVAGGLSDDLAIGAVVQAGLVRRVEGDERLEPTGPFLDGPPVGVVVTANRVVSSAAAKFALWQAVGRPPHCLVDVESWSVVERLAHLGVPWTVVRAVIDAAGEDLPLDFGALSDAEGAVVRSRVVWSLLRRPKAARGVVELRSRIRRSAPRLADIAVQWLVG